MAETFAREKTAAAKDGAVEGHVRPFIVQTNDLTKMYGTFTAVDHLNLQVREGEIFGLLGPNGAGKTTTILMLLGLTEPTHGSLSVCSYNSTREPLKVKSMVGYLPENVGFYDELTAKQNLRYTARLNGLSKEEADKRILDLLEQVGLSGVEDKPTGQFSRGMRQRLGIADVLVKNPRLVILDEPTLGLDPDGVRQLLELIVKMSREQKLTVMLSSHQLQQVQQICDRLCVFVKGRIVAEGSIDDLVRRLAADRQMTTEVRVARATSEFASSLDRLDGVLAVEQSGDLLLVHSNIDLREQISELAGRLGAPLLHLRLMKFGVEDIYFRYFQEG